MIKTGWSTEVDLSEIVCQFAFNMEHNYVVYGFIGSRKFEKHILAVDLDSAKDAAKKTIEDWRPWGGYQPERKGAHRDRSC
jgi:hypothetical protein